MKRCVEMTNLTNVTQTMCLCACGTPRNRSLSLSVSRMETRSATRKRLPSLTGGLSGLDEIPENPWVAARTAGRGSGGEGTGGALAAVLGATAMVAARKRAGVSCM